MTTLQIHGSCPEQFSAVKDAFAANFTDAPEGLNEVGARFSITVEGETVIDLWGGSADTAGEKPFTQTTLVPIFSSGKAVMALMIARLVDQGRLSYADKVADHWPEFGQNGKDQLTIGQLMSHQAGLPGFDEPVEPSIWYDPAAVVARLAAQKPMWEPGTASGYHPISIGLMAGEIFRRLDGRTMGTALREDFCEPYGLHLWIGTPPSEHDRAAEMKRPSSLPNLGKLDELKMAAFVNKGAAPGGRGSAEWRQAEIPSANMHASGADMARILSILANGGRWNGQTFLSEQTLAELAEERIQGPDKILPFTLSWAAGLMRNEGIDIFGPNADALGHCGWGGSLVWADAAARVSGAYVMNRQSPHLLGDPRAVRLVNAVYAAL
ncbi:MULTISPECIES: serine hydrolase domain-containing protein [unclassified Brevundimonas]|uniref:serine hydrolase domain-containing protein n=1 Tax=unclassified Brevundimonas TaxID=2622653 RepID=UPI0025B962FC|nr:MULTISPECIES: serine hydrolase domain-containing protein [unclassified Brevundimonas]